MSGSRDLAQQAFELMQEALRESEARISALDAELRQRHAPKSQLEEQVELLSQRLEITETDCARWRREAGQLEEVVAVERAKIQQLKKRLELAQSGPDAVARKEVNYWRGRIEETGKEVIELREAAAQLRQDIAARENELTLALARAEAAESARHAQAERDETGPQLEQARQEITALRDGLHQAEQRIEQLQADLHEEREHVANISEVSNDRKDRITKLEERVEEAEERYEEARWRLSQAEHFERLVRRRKKLIQSLLAALRAKYKANTALKAGVDSLRTYKARAEQNQHKLLARIDHLMARLSDSDTQLAELRAQLAQQVAQNEAAASVAAEAAAQPASEQATAEVQDSRVEALEQRLNTQAELIAALETELRTTRNALRERDEATDELSRLRNELDMRNQVIAQLQADADERDRKLARLRGSDSETLRLKTEITKLEESVAAWKTKYEFVSAEPPAAYQTAAEK